MILVPVWTVTALAAVMAVKHYLADFLLQTTWMARGKEGARGWLLPLAAHAGCHAGLTLAVALAVAPHLWWLALVDFTIHFAVDRVKAIVGRRTALVPSQAPFWWLMGFDQLLHGLTDLGLVTAFLSL
ncbi:hypothetical protein ASG40_16235 [Methylobacterium sp. Leaf399]|uniref:DUF3307 domain-containing protein n=1 Tax=unclassified Methylobacterium TaxID=2615210 RepID=UPI000700A773|nr:MULTISPECIES: DUF3307 domain-containing protein [unclassified Methylobacterium]KQP49001.1 hypothetical protein ASF39_14760 [Methylobacterium sp. Leaf108]KQT18877.1 hypothetical protein ASG40_16235 [Methylobacterium sp. Leaf399]KQT86873.1 hypothetical protein ASG59_16710 [Methylobacterium sp. Leaf466]